MSFFVSLVETRINCESDYVASPRSQQISDEVEIQKGSLYKSLTCLNRIALPVRAAVSNDSYPRSRHGVYGHDREGRPSGHLDGSQLKSSNTNKHRTARKCLQYIRYRAKVPGNATSSPDSDKGSNKASAKGSWQESDAAYDGVGS